MDTMDSTEVIRTDIFSKSPPGVVSRDFIGSSLVLSEGSLGHDDKAE